MVFAGLGLQTPSKKTRLSVKFLSKFIRYFEHVFSWLFTLLGIDFGSILDLFLSSWGQLGSLGPPCGHSWEPFFPSCFSFGSLLSNFDEFWPPRPRLRGAFWVINQKIAPKSYFGASKSRCSLTGTPSSSTGALWLNFGFMLAPF